MFIRFKDDDEVIRSSHRDAWGYSRALTDAERERIREGHRFIRRCYYALMFLLVLCVGMIVYLSFVS